MAPEPAPRFHALEDGVERAVANAISVLPQFLQHPLSNDRVLRRVVEDVDLPETQEDLTARMP
jgi:hypothetical protein